MKSCHPKSSWFFRSRGQINSVVVLPDPLCYPGAHLAEVDAGLVSKDVEQVIEDVLQDGGSVHVAAARLQDLGLVTVSWRGAGGTG